MSDKARHCRGCTGYDEGLRDPIRGACPGLPPCPTSAEMWAEVTASRSEERRLVEQIARLTQALAVADEMARLLDENKKYIIPRGYERAKEFVERYRAVLETHQ